jgi:hypothetical protein
MFKRKFGIILCLLFSILPYSIVFSQDNIGIKYFGLSIHPKGEKLNARLMPNKLDKNAYLVINLGGEFIYEKFIYEDFLSVKFVQALYADCAERLGGFSHIGIRLKIFEIERHSLFGGIGPTFVFRRNWLELDGYVNPNVFVGDINDKWQHLFLWYGGEFEYKYSISNKIDLAISFVPGYPHLMSLAAGISLKLENQCNVSIQENQE